MKRDTVVNVLLIIAGIVLALALFGAGVLWKGGAAKSPRTISPAALHLSQGELDRALRAEHAARFCCRRHRMGNLALPP